MAGACRGAARLAVGLPPRRVRESDDEVLQNASPELNGRIFYVDTDFRRISENRQRIRQEDLYVMHRVTLCGHPETVAAPGFRCAGWRIVRSAWVT